MVSTLSGTVKWAKEAGLKSIIDMSQVLIQNKVVIGSILDKKLI